MLRFCKEKLRKYRLWVLKRNKKRNVWSRYHKAWNTFTEKMLNYSYEKKEDWDWYWYLAWRNRYRLRLLAWADRQRKNDIEVIKKLLD